MVVILGCVLYFFSVVGLEVFQDTYSHITPDTHANYDTFGKAGIISFQLLVGQDFNSTFVPFFGITWRWSRRRVRGVTP